ncbi:MAG TPA: PPOX class F420-dependent oxidoreductase [Ktedonobacteraceae bacterium]|nr:PPOX class F420-dependent oxidoreductase [Ktedonobacteraceae bacterium]
MAKMSTEECLSFLDEQARTGKLATVRADGSPHVVPIWYVLDGSTIIFTTGENVVKARNMRRDARVSLCVDDERPPFSFVRVDGTVSFSEDLAEMLTWATRIAGRYMGADQAAAYGKRNAVRGELLVRLTPTHIHGEKDIAAWT